MSVGCDAYIVVPVEPQALCESLRSVVFSLVVEVLRTLAEICVDDSLKTVLPCRSELLRVALSDFLNVWSHHVEELVEVCERVAIHGAR